LNKVIAFKATAQIDLYLAEIVRLRTLSPEEGREEYNLLHKKVEGFVRIVFSDSEDKLNSLNSFFYAIVPSQSAEVERRRQMEDYQHDLTKLQRHLIAYKEEIDLAVRLEPPPEEDEGRERTPRGETRAPTPATPIVNIGTNYGNVSVGGDINIAQIYNQAIERIDKAQGLDPEEKSNAKKVIDFAKDNAPQLLAVVIEGVMKGLGI
jgi:hypothetical protein